VKVACPGEPMPFFQTITLAARTFIERRRSLRDQVQYSAWIEIGNGSLPRHCVVLDVSEEGARIMLASAATLPQEFSLVFTKYGRICRRCRMVWRSGVEVGVEYLGPLECEDAPHAARGAFLTH